MLKALSPWNSPPPAVFSAPSLGLRASLKFCVFSAVLISTMEARVVRGTSRPL